MFLCSKYLPCFDIHYIFVLFKHQFIEFCNSFVTDIEKTSYLIYLHVNSDTGNILDDSNINECKDSNQI